MFKWLKKRKKERTLEEQAAANGFFRPEGRPVTPRRPPKVRAPDAASPRPEPPPAPMPVGRDVCMHCKTGYRTDREYANAVCEKTGFTHASTEHLLKTEEFRRRGQ